MLSAMPTTDRRFHACQGIGKNCLTQHAGVFQCTYCLPFAQSQAVLRTFSMNGTQICYMHSTATLPSGKRPCRQLLLSLNIPLPTLTETSPTCKASTSTSCRAADESMADEDTTTQIGQGAFLNEGVVATGATRALLDDFPSLRDAYR